MQPGGRKHHSNITVCSQDKINMTEMCLGTVSHVELKCHLSKQIEFNPSLYEFHDVLEDTARYQQRQLVPFSINCIREIVS